jgi:hypothetical protein
MKVGFHLSLSRSMLEFLCATADGVHWDRSLYHHDMITPENWIASSCALIKRGLIERLTREEIDAQDRSQDHVEGAMYERTNYRLTPAGIQVIGLLLMAGLFVEADAAINKRARRA